MRRSDSCNRAYLDPQIPPDIALRALRYAQRVNYVWQSAATDICRRVLRSSHTLRLPSRSLVLSRVARGPEHYRFCACMVCGQRATAPPLLPDILPRGAAGSLSTSTRPARTVLRPGHRAFFGHEIFEHWELFSAQATHPRPATGTHPLSRRSIEGPPPPGRPFPFTGRRELLGVYKCRLGMIPENRQKTGLAPAESSKETASV
jgi:hypothetical protein